VETIMPISSRLVVNQTALKTKVDLIGPLIRAIESAVAP
jgi:ATP phosphoribosyltransferase